MQAQTTMIDGTVYTLFRPAPDLPYAEVWLERADGLRWAVNTQYAIVNGALNPRAFSGIDGSAVADLLPVGEQIVAAARAYLDHARKRTPPAPLAQPLADDDWLTREMDRADSIY